MVHKQIQNPYGDRSSRHLLPSCYQNGDGTTSPATSPGWRIFYQATYALCICAFVMTLLSWMMPAVVPLDPNLDVPTNQPRGKSGGGVRNQGWLRNPSVGGVNPDAPRVKPDTTVEVIKTHVEQEDNSEKHELDGGVLEEEEEQQVDPEDAIAPNKRMEEAHEREKKMHEEEAKDMADKNHAFGEETNTTETKDPTYDLPRVAGLKANKDLEPLIPLNETVVDSPAAPDPVVNETAPVSAESVAAPKV